MLFTFYLYLNIMMIVIKFPGTPKAQKAYSSPMNTSGGCLKEISSSGCKVKSVVPLSDVSVVRTELHLH